MSDSLRPTGCSVPGFPAQTHVHWVRDVIQPSHLVTPFSCPQSFPASGSFPMSWLFVSGGQSVGASASALPMWANNFYYCFSHLKLEFWSHNTERRHHPNMSTDRWIWLVLFPGPTHINWACSLWNKFWQAMPLSSLFIRISAESNGMCILISTENTTALQRGYPVKTFSTSYYHRWQKPYCISALLTDEVPFIVFFVF